MNTDTQSLLSIVVPLYNEQDNVVLLTTKIHESLQGYSYQIVYVDDFSTDNTRNVVKEMNDPLVHLIELKKNYGQSLALAAGIDYAEGEYIITMDGDLQNDPADIPKLLVKLDEGYDLVSGWRKHRQDNAITRLLPSKIANSLISLVTEVKLHDYGCSLKAYRKEVVQDMNLYGELHRFLPALAFIEGARITEIPVNHYARKFGSSKYGLGRTFRVVMDLMTVYFMKRFLTKPMHVFGSLGMISTLSGIGLGIYLTLVKILAGQDIGDRPLLILAVVLFLTGIQLFSFGLLAELLMRTYHESQKRPIYRIREIVSASGLESN